MNFKKSLLTLLVFPTLAFAVATPFKLPGKITLEENGTTVKALTGLNSVLQLLYNLEDVKQALLTTKSTDPFTSAIGRLFGQFQHEGSDQAILDQYTLMYKNTSKNLDDIPIDPTVIVKNLSRNVPDLLANLTHEQSFDALADFLQKFNTNATLPYHLVTVNYSENPNALINIFDCKNSELVGFITFICSKDAIFTTDAWQNTLYSAFVKIGNDWMFFSLGFKDGVKISEDVIKKVPFIKGLLNGTTAAYHYPVVLIYKKSAGSNEPEKKLTTVDSMPDFAKALDQI